MEHYYTENPTSQDKRRKIPFTLDGVKFDFITNTGTFSQHRIDPGTALLLRSVLVHENDKVLDLGCGYGPLGIVLKALHPSLDIVMVDVNKRALNLTRENANRMKVKVKLKGGSLYKNVKNFIFNTIITNPPYKAGRKLCYEIIDNAPDYLEKNGTLQLVGMHNKGGSMMEKKMKDVFGNVKTLGKKSGYRVYLSIKEV